MNNMLRELLSQNIGIRTMGNIHAKLIITDRHLVVSSVNLNKMNLGFSVTSRYWRENTESIAVCSNNEIIRNARMQYLKIYDESIDIEKKLAENIESFVGKMFTSKFDLRSKQEVKTLFARLIIKKEIEAKRFVFEVGRITALLVRLFNKNIVDKNDFISALILYYLSERKHDFNELNEKLDILDTEIDLVELLSILSDKNLIEKSDDFYKIKLDLLLGGGLKK